ncbi:hypothetical protein DPEC_G00338440 [Dallia pectoralis]|uniref:Uncharacterized protein n=1 Tax=Dallia pectoralis TaxID=75939 RepID=A0ACC2F4L3_DALPE|nr:hypothetical protein DPEC_G00338440 [Dallia pectoralis]
MGLVINQPTVPAVKRPRRAGTTEPHCPSPSPGLLPAVSDPRRWRTSLGEASPGFIAIQTCLSEGAVGMWKTCRRSGHLDKCGTVAECPGPRAHVPGAHRDGERGEDGDVGQGDGGRRGRRGRWNRGPARYNDTTDCNVPRPQGVKWGLRLPRKRRRCRGFVHREGIRQELHGGVK